MKVIDKTWHRGYSLFLVWLVLFSLLWLFLKINWKEFRYLGYLSMPVALGLSFLAYGQANLIFKYRLFFNKKNGANTKIFGFLKSLGLVGFFVLSSLILTGLLIALVAWGIFQVSAVRMDVLLKRDIYFGLDMSTTPIFWWLLGVSLLFGCVLSTQINSKFVKPNLYVMVVGTGLSLLSFFGYLGPAISNWVSL